MILRPLFRSLCAIVLLIASSCQSPEEGTAVPRPRPGEWRISFLIGDPAGAVRIPVRMSVDSTGLFRVHNNGETIVLDSVQWTADSFHIKMPLFQSFLSGKLIGDSLLLGRWSDPTRTPDYAVPFEAVYQSDRTAVQGISGDRLIYETTFSPEDSSDRYPAVGVFDRKGDRVSGTFLTETGDYRFLDGEMDDSTLWLSCFDGSHLFFFTGNVEGDSITRGRFYSGRHWQEPWVAVRNERARLRDPDSLTVLKVDQEGFRFSARNLSGGLVEFGPEQFKGKVTVVQIFGSWCPNCTDESIFLRGLYERHKSSGLQIIPVAFERSDDLAQNIAVVTEQWKELEIPYPAYIGSGKGKKKAEETFPMLNRVMSFPTSIFLDKTGTVRKIHTGFYGPGTGQYYAHYSDRLAMFVEQLLNEQ